MMKNLIRFIKRIFGVYETGYEYWVYLRDIKISPEFERTPPRFKKMGQKWSYYRNTGEFESPIILNRNSIWIYRHLTLLAQSWMFWRSNK